MPLAADSFLGVKEGRSLRILAKKLKIPVNKGFTKDLVIVETELARAGLLVLNDTWYPGWTAVVHKDGQSYPAEIYRANGVLRGVWLNAGKQTIDFRFHPQSFYVGASISAISWLIAPAIGLWRVRRNRDRLRRQME